MNTISMDRAAGVLSRSFTLALLWNFLWINASEIIRYFALVMPMMRKEFAMVENVAPMDWTVFAIWGIWDFILILVVTSVCWLIMERFGSSVKLAIIAGTFCWFSTFVILWLGLFNMNLATANLLFVALPLSWIELVIASLIVRHFMSPIGGLNSAKAEHSDACASGMDLA